MKSLQLIVLSLGLTYGGIAAASNTEAAVGGALGGALGSVVGEHLGGSTGATIGAGVGGASVVALAQRAVTWSASASGAAPAA